MTLSINGKTYDTDELIAYHKRLEKENELLKADLEFSAKMSSKNKQAVKEYQKLVSEYSSEGADLQDRIKNLEQENAELKADYEVLSCSVGDFEELQDKLEEEQRKNNVLSDNLTKAKEIIKKLINACCAYGATGRTTAEAEQFISEGKKGMTENSNVPECPSIKIGCDKMYYVDEVEK